MGSGSPESVLQICNILVPDILAEDSLAVAGVVPHVVEAAVHHQGVKAIGGVTAEWNPGFVEDLVSKITVGEFDTHGKVVALPATG